MWNKKTVSRKPEASRKESVSWIRKKIKAAVRMLLEGIGEDPDREGLVETPDRIARMCEEVYGGLYEDAARPPGKTIYCGQQ